MGVLHDIVDALFSRWITSKSISLSQSIESIATSGDDLVNIRLMASIEDDRILRAVEDAMDGEGQFNDAEVWPEVATAA